MSTTINPSNCGFVTWRTPICMRIYYRLNLEKVHNYNHSTPKSLGAYFPLSRYRYHITRVGIFKYDKLNSYTENTTAAVNGTPQRDIRPCSKDDISSSGSCRISAYFPSPHKVLWGNMFCRLGKSQLRAALRIHPSTIGLFSFNTSECGRIRCFTVDSWGLFESGEHQRWA